VSAVGRQHNEAQGWFYSGTQDRAEGHEIYLDYVCFRGTHKGVVVVRERGIETINLYANSKLPSHRFGRRLYFVQDKNQM